MNHHYNLFSVYGIELEYMIVNRDTLAIMPISDLLLKEKAGHITSEVENGEIAWSNELTAHVIEMKTNGPKASLRGLSNQFAANVTEMNNLLAKHNAMLLPTAAHPFMDPFTQTVLWQHEYNEVYELYNRIFDCRGHGWSNLQSMHLNLPFANDAEFEKLHAAIRLVLPIIPALAASSPILDGAPSTHRDARMLAYSTHQMRLPVLMGAIIPEQAYSKLAYEQQIFNPISEAIRPFDVDRIMDKHFLNSRGAIARFDRGAIEIRVIDIQECPKADIAIAEMIIAVIKALVAEKTCTLGRQKTWHRDDLRGILDLTIKNAERAIIKDSAYLNTLGMHTANVSAQDLWQFLFEKYRTSITRESQDIIQKILNNGSLSSRILDKVGQNPTPTSIKWSYEDLADCLASNTLYI